MTLPVHRLFVFEFGTEFAHPSSSPIGYAEIRTGQRAAGGPSVFARLTISHLRLDALLQAFPSAALHRVRIGSVWSTAPQLSALRKANPRVS